MTKSDDPTAQLKLALAGLRKKGNLYFEINQYLANETEEILKNSGFKTELKKDIFGNYRMLRGRKKSNNGIL